MKRVLFVDDEPKILDGISRMMYAERKNWDMKFAVGGEAALQAFEAAPFDVIVSDMRMPGMDGATLLTRIRASYPATVRIILSGYTERETALRALSVAHRFLAKPCDPALLRQTVERACELQAQLNSPEIRRVVASIGELPALSSTYLALSQAIEDPTICSDKVTLILELDVAMSAKVLQLANSAFFGLAQTVTSVSHAVTYLGIETIKNLVLVADTFHAFVPSALIPASTWQNLQQHGHDTSVIIGRLSCDKKTRDVAIVGALLHDIGKLVLASHMPDSFLKIQSLADEKQIPGFKAEEEILGISHAEIGAYLLGLWGIPQSVVEAIAFHHRPTEILHSGFDLSEALYVADLISHLPVFNPDLAVDCGLAEADKACLQELGLWNRFPEFRRLAARED